MLDIETVYENTNEWSAYQGIVLKEDSFVEYLSSRVRAKLHDVEGTEALIEEFRDTPSTGFEEQLLIDIFSSSHPIDDWKIGEALAECYLEDFEKVRFYYTSSRDAKNPKANLQGADLVGFIDIDEDTTIFLFGEVKTSGDENSPPQVMYGRSGMIDQLRKIRNDTYIRKSLIRWLGFKVKNLTDDDPFKKDYGRALKVYLQEVAEHKYFLFGILIRDTKPKDTDLKSGYKSLKSDLSNGVRLKLVALYLPMRIKNMKNYVINKGKTNG